MTFYILSLGEIFHIQITAYSPLMYFNPVLIKDVTVIKDKRTEGSASGKWSSAVTFANRYELFVLPWHQKRVLLTVLRYE